VRDNFFYTKYFNYFLFLFPIYFYLGPVVTEVSFLLLVAVVIFFNYRIVLNEKYNFEFQDFIILFFFLLIILTSLVHYEQSSLQKSLFLIRFIIFYYIINIGKVNKNIFKFSLLSLLIILVTSLDIIYQVIFNYDFLGNFTLDNRPHIFFRSSEQISGSLISRFLFFTTILFLYKKNFLLSCCFSIFLIFVIFLSGERANFITSIIFFILLIIFFLKNNLNNKKIKYYIFLAFIFSFFLFKIFTPENKIKRLFSSKVVIQEYLNKDKNNPWFSHFIVAKNLFEKNIVIGNGINSFRITCNRDNLHGCSTHPHNIYLEILVETGLVGLSFFLIFNFITIVNSFKILKNINFRNYISFLYLAIFFQYLAYLFPFRPTGSFFNNLNLYYYFFLFALLNNRDILKKLK
jgi:hypothetical protein